MSATRRAGRASSSSRRSSRCTFEKVHWSVPRATSSSPTCSRSCFLGVVRDRQRGRACRRRRPSLLAFFAALPARLPRRLLQPRDRAGARAVRQGDGEVRRSTSSSSRWRSPGSPGAAPRTTGGRSRGSAAASSSTRSTASSSSLAARAGVNLDAAFVSPLTGGASQINIYGAVDGASVYRPNALTGDPNHLGIMLIVPLLVLTPIYLRLERGHRLRRRLARAARVPARRRARDALAQRPARPRRRRARAPAPVPALPAHASSARPARRRARASLAAVVLVAAATSSSSCFRSRVQTGGGSTSAHFQVYDFIPQILHSHPLFGLGLNNFSVYYEFVTGKTNWGPHSFYVALLVETGLVGTALFARLPALGVPAAARRPRARRARSPRRRPARPRACARSRGADRGARRDDGRERLLPDDAVLLLLRVPGARARGAARLPAVADAVKVARPDDVVSAPTERRRRRLRRRRGRGRCASAGVEVRVVSPADFRHFGIAYGGGIVQNLRAKPWLVAAVPLFLAVVRAGRPARRARRRPRARALDPVGARGARDRASRTCSRCGARTSSSRGARRGSCARSCAARGS